MKYALNIGSPFGIRISIHWTFLLLIAWIVIVDLQRGMDLEQILMSILFIIVLFICVILHELGHSLAARRYGSDVRSITLLPIGGMANITKIPEKPGEELVVSVAGLIVNVIIAALIWAILTITTGGIELERIDITAITGKNFFVMLMGVNILLVVFNLIPAFPMDGGRILRAFLSFKMDRVRATNVSKTIGQLFAVGFMILGIFVNPFLIIIGIFVFIGANAEYQMVKFGSALHNFKVEDVLITDFMTIGPGETIAEAADLLVHHRGNAFIVMSDDKMEGILTKDDIIRGITEYGLNGRVKEVMTTGVFTVDKQSPLNEVFQEMQQKRYAIVPVIFEGKIIGVIELENLNEFMRIQNALH